MRRELRQVVDDLGVGPSSPGGKPQGDREGDGRARRPGSRDGVACATTLNARMKADGQESDWDYLPKGRREPTLSL